MGSKITLSDLNEIERSLIESKRKNPNAFKYILVITTLIFLYIFYIFHI